MDLRDQQRRINEAQETLLPKYQAELRRTIGGQAVFEIDWDSFSADPPALQSLASRAFDPVLSALRELCSDEPNLKRTQAAVRKIVIRNTPSSSSKQFNCRDGTLEMRSAWSGDYFSGFQIRHKLQRVISSGDFK